MGTRNGAASLFHGMGARVTRQVGGDESALTRDHVAAGAFCLGKENFLSAVGIAGQIGRLLGSLKSAEARYYGLDIRTFEGVEGGHSGSRNAVLNHPDNLIIGEPLHSWVFGDVGRALAASPVETVTLGAATGKYLLAVAREGMDWIFLPLRLPQLHWRAEERTSQRKIPTERRWVRTFPLAVARRVLRIQSA